MHRVARRFSRLGLLLPAIAAAFLFISCEEMSPTSARPPIFDTRPYTEAKAAAQSEGKEFLVKATAEWCGPCKKMDATTWRDAKVIEFLQDRAIVVALDVDAESEHAAALGVSAMPTMILFDSKGNELGRSVGYQGPAELLEWLREVEASQS